MKLEVVDLGPCKKRLTVEVAVEKVKEEYDEVCEELGRNVELPGFRKGRVPRTLLVSKFGRQIDADVKGKLLDSSFKDAVKEKELEPVGEPDLDVEKVEFDIEQPLKYECEIEVKPEFEAPAYEGLKIEKPGEEVSDEEIAEAIDRIRRRFAEVHPVSGPAQAEDFVVVDVKLTIDGKEAWKDSELALGLTEERALGLPFELASSELVGAEAGKKISAEVEVPLNFKIEEYRGKKADAEIQVKDVKRPKLPEFNDELAKRVGEPSAEGLRLRVRGGLIEEKKSQAEREVRRQVLDQLIAAVSFELPEKLLERTAERDQLRRRYQLEQMGLKEDSLSDDARQEMHNVSRQQAEHDLRAFLILERIAKAREIEASDEEVDAHFAALAARRGVDPAALKRHAEERGELEGVKGELCENKVMELILSAAQITEKKPEPPAKKKAPEKKAEKKAEKKPEKKAAVEEKAPEKKAAKKPAKKPAKKAEKKPAAKKPAPKKKAPKKPAKKSDKK